MQSQQQRECASCEKPGNGIRAVCRGTALVTEEFSKSRFRSLSGMNAQVARSSCNNPGNRHKKGDVKCFAFKGKGYVVV